MKKTWKQALSMVVCLVLLAGMMTVVPVGAASTMMYYPMETEDVLETSFYASHDSGKYTSSVDNTTKTVDLNGIVDATVSFSTPGANSTAGAVMLTMLNETSTQETDKKLNSSGTEVTVTRGQDYRPRLITKDQISLAPGNTYKVSYYIKGSNLTGSNRANLWLNTGNKVSFDGDTSTTGSAYRDVIQVTVTDEWQYVEKEFKVTAITDSAGASVPTAAMTLGMRVLSNYPSGILYVDELKVELTEKAPAANDYFATGKGDGTEEDPYELTTAEDISKAAELTTSTASFASAHYKLMNDIDMTGITDYQGFGKFNGNCAFSGTLDGNNHVISNLTITTEETRPRGLISRAEGATVKNLGLVDSDITGFPAGGLIGYVMGTTATTVENCFVRDTVLNTNFKNEDGVISASAQHYVGGIIGGVKAYNGGVLDGSAIIKNCYTSDLTVYHNKAKGISGALVWNTVSGAELTNCYSTLPILVGDEGTTSTVTNSVASATTENVTAVALGTAFIANNTSYNSGLPVLAWEADRLPKNYKVTVTVGENGSVTKDGEAAPSSFEAEEGTTVTLTLVPDSKYAAKVKVNGSDYTVTNNQVTLTVAEDTVINVTFEAIPDVAPGIVGGETSYSWFKAVDGVPTIYTYHKLSAFNTGEANLQYGVKLWNNANPEAKVTLAARNAATGEPAVAEPGAMFAIKAYGTGITANQTYSVQPYVGEASGDTAAPQYEQ